MTDAAQVFVRLDGNAGIIGNHARHVETAEVIDFLRYAADVLERVDGNLLDGFDWRVIRTLVVSLHQGPRHGNLVFGGFGQRNADGITDAVFQQSADSHGGFDASVLGFAGFSYAQVERVGLQAFLVQPLHQQAVGFHHHLRVAGFHGKDDLHVAHFLTNPQKLQSRLHHAEWRIAVAAQNPVGQGAVVGADAHGGAVFLANLDQRRELLPNPHQLGGVGCVGVVDDLEPLAVGVVAGIDSDFLDNPRGQFGGIRRKVNIGNQRNPNAFGQQPLLDVFQILRLLDAWGGNPHVLTTRLDHPNHFGNRAFGIHRVHRSHRLHPNGIIRTHW